VAAQPDVGSAACTRGLKQLSTVRKNHCTSYKSDTEYSFEEKSRARHSIWPSTKYEQDTYKSFDSHQPTSPSQKKNLTPPPSNPKFPLCPATMSNTPIILITGGNTGIGYETVKALYASPTPSTILMGSRSLTKAHAAISTLQSEVPDSSSTVTPLQVDIENDDSVQAAFNEVHSKHGRIDALVNNAGASFDLLMRNDASIATLRTAWDKAYSLNVTSTQAFTYVFMPLLLASPSPRLLFITSGLSSLSTCASGTNSKALAPGAAAKGWPKPATPSMVAYRSSKTALNMMMLDWARMLEPDGVKVFAISPGFLATGLGGLGKDALKGFGAGDASVGGEFIRDVVGGKRDGDAGKVVHKDGVQPW